MKSKTQTQELISKDMLIGEVISKHPETASVMKSYGLHCVGCSANPFDTIESGCLIHGMSEETVDKLVVDINKTIEKKNDVSRKVISVTKNAADKFVEFMKDEGKENCGVKISVHGGGSDGLQYTLDFADKSTSTEEVVEDQGMKFFIEKDFVNLIKGTQIDFITNEKGSGFKIDNPNNVSGGCGCSE